MVKSPQRPTSKSRSGGSTRSRTPKAATNSTSKPNETGTGAKSTSTGAKTSSSSSKPAGSATQLTPKPTTIDLEASAVKTTAAKSAPNMPTKSQPTKDAAASKPTPDVKQAAAATAAAANATATSQASSKKPDAKPATDPAANSAKASPATGASKPTQASKAQPPRPEMTSPRAQSQRGGGTSILAMVLAGGVGGIITLLGAYALLGSGLLKIADDSNVDATQAQMSELSGTVSGLSDQSSALSESIANLDTRIEALAQQPADTSGTDALQADIDALRMQINETLAAGQGSLETASATQSEIQDALNALETQLASLSGAMTSQNEIVAGELSRLADQQNALENSVAEGDAGEGPALAALEGRLTALSDEINTQAEKINAQADLIGAQADQIGVQSAAVPVPVREELNAIGEMVTNLQDQLAIMETLQLTAQQQQLDLQSLTDTVEGVAGTVKRVAGKTDRLEETVAAPPEEQPDAAMDGARLAYVQSALNTAIANGMPFAGLVTQARTLMADNGSTVELPEEFLQAAQSGLTPLPALASQISDARDAYDASLSSATAAEETAADDDNVTAKGLFDGIMKGAQGLVTIRDTNKTETAAPDVLSAQLGSAATAASAGDLAQLSASLDEIAANAAAPDTLQQSVLLWQLQTQHHQSAAGLQDQLEAVQLSIWSETSEGDPS